MFSSKEKDIKGDRELKNTKYYSDVLTDDQIYEYASLIDEFDSGKINYHELKQRFAAKGITLGVTLYFYGDEGLPRTAEEAKALKARIASESYVPRDISKFTLKGIIQQDVIFCIDYKAIEVLAKRGNQKYMQTLNNILGTQHSIDGDQEIAGLKAGLDSQENENKHF